MKNLTKIDGETVCLILLAVSIFMAMLAAFIESAETRSKTRFTICPLCEQPVKQK